MTPGRIARPLAGLLLGWSFWAGAAERGTLEHACESIGGRLASVGVDTCLESKLKISGATSVRGTALLYRDFEPPADDRVAYPGKGPKRVMMIGGIHGDELTSVSITFKWMRFLDEGGDQPFHWRVVPSANPDGLLTRPSTRTNARGVDLNRNFPTDDWENNAINYWKKRTKSDKRRYPGPRPLSEPETRWLTEQIREFKPDAIVAVHAPFGVLDYDGPREPPAKFGYLRLKVLGTYPGSLGNYAGFNLNVPVITLELPHAGIMPTAQQTEQVWSDMLRWLRENLPKPLRPESSGALAATKSKLTRESP
jgi:murein peptide amidase A